MRSETVFPSAEPLLKKVDWDAGGGASQQVISRDMEIVCNHFQFDPNQEDVDRLRNWILYQVTLK